MVVAGGNDDTIEEGFFIIGPAAVARGYNFFTFSYPGVRNAVHTDPVQVKRPDPKIFVLTFLAHLVATIGTSLLAAGVGVASIADGAALGVVVGVGYALTAAAVTAIYDQKPSR